MSLFHHQFRYFAKVSKRTAQATLGALFVSTAALPATAMAAEHHSATAAEHSNALTYPASQRDDTLVETLFDVEVADPYRWLEGDVRSNPNVADWVTKQKNFTDKYLAKLPSRNAFIQRMRALYDYERFGIPKRAGNRYFYSKNDGLQPQSVLYVRDGLDGTSRPLLDPNTWAQDGATALSEWKPSSDGQYLLYAVQDGGTDWRILRVRNVASGEDTADEVRWVKFSNIAWAKDGSGFYYSRFPEPEGGDRYLSLNKNHAVYFHRLGTPQAADVLVHATPNRPDLNHSAEVTDDGAYLLVTSSEGTDDRYVLTLYAIGADGKHSTPLVLAEDFDYNWNYVTSEGAEFTFLTDKGAPRQRLVVMNIALPASLREIVAEDQATLVSASAVGERLILSYLKDARSEARMVTRQGKAISKITLGSIGTASGFQGSPKYDETFYRFSSFARPSTIYHFDTRTGTSTIFAEPKLTFNPQDYAVEQRFYTSKDGSQIPMFLVMKKGVDRTGGSPTLLYGYGGFNISITPGFVPARLAWMERGGVLAIANLRGGGEYGKEWHDAGRRANKQNVFDDFIAAAEYLIDIGLTSKDQLAIEGRSNGGLLVGAVVNQRPDLFAAALPHVGVMDMLRFDRFTAGRYWVDDYGYPNREADFKILLSYSPYHNIADGKRYPAILVTTADTDDRVVPGHSFKYTAALQAADIGDHPHMIRIETRAGHGSGKPVDKIIGEAADSYAFIAYWTGMDAKDSKRGADSDSKAK